jgi:hypothetical protein
MKVIYYTIFVSWVSCKAPQFAIVPCDMEQAILVANRTVKKVGYSLDLLKYSIEPLDSFYVINYLPKDFNMRGGEAILKISQTNCKVVQKDFYQ